MTTALSLLVAVPATAALVVGLLPEDDEAGIARVTHAAAALVTLLALGATAAWFAGGLAPVQTPPLLTLHAGAYEFTAPLLFDGYAALFLLMTAFLFGIVARFSASYMRREPGHRRFFAMILLFASGMNLTILAGNLDLVFAGWEMVGLSSFLLIGFYRGRPQAARNALWVYSVYRFTDLGLLIGTWLEHRLLQHHASFLELSDPGVSRALFAHGTALPLAIAGLLLLSAAGKSAQFPFSFWIPRAMEGPTPSSAVFYGALSVHAGLYLLLRTEPLWRAHPWGAALVAAAGAATAVIAAPLSRAQSTVKAQIGYASIAQVGIMFVTLAAGWPRLAAAHAAANACLRCFQLLVSPSIVAYLLRRQGSNDAVRVDEWSWERLLPARARSTLYVFALNDAYLERSVRFLLWEPVRRLSEAARRAPVPAAVLAAGVAAAWARRTQVPHAPFAAAALAASVLLGALAAAAPRRLTRVWLCAGASNALIAASVWFASGAAWSEVLPFLAGSAVPGLTGLVLLPSFAGEGESEFRGLERAAPGRAVALFVCLLAAVGFPPSPAFWGWDMLLTASARSSPVEAAGVCALFVLNTVAVVRAYAHAFWGWEDSTRSIRRFAP